MSLKTWLKDRTDETTEPGLPVEVGLLTTSGKELKADWYTRKPWALEVKWQCDDANYRDPTVWEINGLVEFDSDGREVSRRWTKVAKVMRGDEIVFTLDLRA